MAIIDSDSGVIKYKVVFFGPGLAGKTSNLQLLHSQAAQRSRLICPSSETDRLLFFTFSPLSALVDELAVRVACYTVPGCVFYEQSRIEVLRGVDGVVCVMDSQEPRLEANIEMLENLDFYLHSLGYEPSEVPRVIQYNKQDLPLSLPPKDLRAVLNPSGWQDYSAVACQGRGVLETMVGILRLVLDKAGMPADACVFEDWLLHPAPIQVPSQAGASLDHDSVPVPAPALTRWSRWLARLRQAAT